MTIRPITAKDFAPIVRDGEPGEPPRLAWLPVSRLVVDDSYQRRIYGHGDGRAGGRTNIRHIAAHFRWSRFSPVICAPVDEPRAADGSRRYAVIDGQHRATAALLVGIDEVPCWIVPADRREQAECFAAINGMTKRLSSLDLHKAAVAAGDVDAERIEAAARAAGVTVLRYPVPMLRQQPGETMAVATLAAALRRHGDEAVTLALRAIAGPARNRKPGMLIHQTIAAMAEVAAVALVRGWAPQRLLAMAEQVDLLREFGQAEAARRRGEGVSVTALLIGRLRRMYGLV